MITRQWTWLRRYTTAFDNQQYFPIKSWLDQVHKSELVVKTEQGFILA